MSTLSDNIMSLTINFRICLFHQLHKACLLYFCLHPHKLGEDCNVNPSPAVAYNDYNGGENEGLACILVFISMK